MRGVFGRDEERRGDVRVEEVRARVSLRVRGRVV